MNTDTSDDIKIKLSATHQSGIIAALHLIANTFGTRVKDNLVSRVSREKNRVIVIFAGSLNATQAEFTDAIESHSRIYSIDDIEIGSNLSIYSDDTSVPDEEIEVDQYTDFESIVNEIEDTDFETIVAEVDDNDFESIANEVDDIEFESDSNVYQESETELVQGTNLYAEDNLDSESDHDTYSDNTVEPETMDIHYNENSPLKVSKNITYKFDTDDLVTEDALETTEEILIDLLGPVASLFVSTAVIEANTMGELFVLLSEELDGDVKSNFLGLVKGIDKSQFELN